MILVACEESQRVTQCLRELGLAAYSNDILPTTGDHPEWHLQTDLRGIINDGWDMIIAFPPCTHLASSGARWFKEKMKDGRQQQGIEFFMMIVNANCPRIAIENPVGIMSNIYRKPDQIVQPWMFGHPEKKSTCLWLKGLPKLKPTNDVSGLMKTLPKQQTERIHYMPPSPTRSLERSKTYLGVAKAMAEQWGAYTKAYTKEQA